MAKRSRKSICFRLDDTDRLEDAKRGEESEWHQFMFPGHTQGMEVLKQPSFDEILKKINDAWTFERDEDLSILRLRVSASLHPAPISKSNPRIIGEWWMWERNVAFLKGNNPLIIFYLLWMVLLRLKCEGKESSAGKPFIFSPSVTFAGRKRSGSVMLIKLLE